MLFFFRSHSLISSLSPCFVLCYLGNEGQPRWCIGWLLANFRLLPNILLLLLVLLCVKCVQGRPMCVCMCVFVRDNIICIVKKQPPTKATDQEQQPTQTINNNTLDDITHSCAIENRPLWKPFFSTSTSFLFFHLLLWPQCYMLSIIFVSLAPLVLQSANITYIHEIHKHRHAHTRSKKNTFINQI